MLVNTVLQEGSRASTVPKMYVKFNTGLYFSEFFFLKAKQKIFWLIASVMLCVCLSPHIATERERNF